MMTEDDHLLSGFLAELKLSLGTIANGVKKLSSDNDRARMANAPKFARIHGRVTTTAGGFGVISFDNKGPDSGDLWFVRKLAVGGSTPTTTANGRADVFVTAGGLEQTTVMPGMSGWEDQATSLPLIGDYSPGELVLQHPEKLYVIISSGGASQEYVCRGTVQVIQMAAFAQTWSL